MPTATRKKPHAPKTAKRPAAREREPESEVVAVPLARLDLEACTAARAATDDDAVSRYAERYADGLPMPPIRCAGVKGEEDGPLFVGDGGHRVAGARAAGKATVDATVVWCETADAARGRAWAIAYASNADHGLPRSSDDLRAVVRAALLREHPASSDRAIGDKVGCNRKAVMKVRVLMTEADELTGKASAKGRYADSVYNRWIIDRLARPEAGRPDGERAPDPEAVGPAARPPEPATATPDDSAADPAWRSAALAQLDIDPKVEAKLTAAGVGTAGELADALDRPGRPVSGLGDADHAELRGIVAVLAAEGLVLKDAPAAPPAAELPPDDRPDHTPPAARPPVALATPADDIPTDEKGRPVPAHLRDVFAARTLFRSIVARVGSIIREAEELAASPHGAAIHVQGVRIELEKGRGWVSGGMPYVVCPSCDGKGKQGPKGCPTCQAEPMHAKPTEPGRGWVCRDRYGQFTGPLKEVCEGPWNEQTERGGRQAA